MDRPKRKNASAAKGAVKKKRCVADILSQEQELAGWFADHSLFYDQI